MLTLIHSLRGVAAFFVVFFHVSRHIQKEQGGSDWGDFWEFGDVGVQFFFVLSGFIIYYTSSSKIGKSSYLGHFLYRRFIRVYLPYWAVIIPLFIGYRLWPQFGEARHQNVGLLLSSMALIPGESGRFLGVAWTLVYEVFFYLLFSLAIYSRRLLPIVIGSLVVASSLRFFGVLIPFIANPNWILFVFGIFSAMLVGKYDFRKYSRLILFAGSVIFIFSCFLHVGVTHSHLVVLHDLSVLRFGIASSFILVGSYYLRCNFSRILGDSSYSLYLVHIPIIGAVSSVFEKLNFSIIESPLLAFCSLSLCSIIGGVLFSRFIEYPMLKFIRNKFEKC